MFAWLQQTCWPKQDWPVWQQLGPHTEAGLQQPPPGSTPPIRQHWPVMGSHCRSALQQRLLVGEPQVLDVGQQAPLTQVLPAGLQGTVAHPTAAGMELTLSIPATQNTGAKITGPEGLKVRQGKAGIASKAKCPSPRP